MYTYVCDMCQRWPKIKTIRVPILSGKMTTPVKKNFNRSIRCNFLWIRCMNTIRNILDQTGTSQSEYSTKSKILLDISVFPGKNWCSNPVKFSPILICACACSCFFFCYSISRWASLNILMILEILYGILCMNGCSSLAGVWYIFNNTHYQFLSS